MPERTEAPLRIGIVGDFDRGKHSHWATEAALFHAAARLGLSVEPRWVPTSSLAASGSEEGLAEFDGIWGAPGSPYLSLLGMLRAIEYARVRDRPFLGTCGGFQHALIEFTRNVLGIRDADSAEHTPDGRNIVISLVQCPLPGPASGPLMCGTDVAQVVPGTLLEQCCGSGDLRGEYFCSFETNRDFVPRWVGRGLRVAALGAEREMRAFELPQNRFFVATLFQPQLSSSFQRPHRIIEGYLRACSSERVHQGSAR
jgi:CTP synthase (UTP-ammonia lyase)